ncbi:Na+/H+ antiporter subunit E [Candidatus Spongiihabitans sp.]|uniref:Na+/H+ antiporter subunit E n=1 Tax=Candidatus Spongiihabitans sp. TaxID=3101308 RepID=UPI003C7B8264
MHERHHKHAGETARASAKIAQPASIIAKIISGRFAMRPQKMPPKPYRRHLIALVGLAAIWCLLSGHYTALLLSLGALSCLASYWVYRRVAGQTTLPRPGRRPLRHALYTAWLVGEIIKSSVAVIGAIFNPKKLAPQFFSVDASGLDETGRVIYANSITRTPGTVSVDVSETEIQVHGLLARSKAGLMDNKMLAKVRRLAANR